MKHFLKSLLLLLFISGFANAQEISALSAKTFQYALRQSSYNQLLDLRSAVDFANGHIKGAKFIDFSKNDFESLVLRVFNKNKPIFIYSSTGSQANNATVFLKDLGFSEIYFLEKGFTDWTASSHPYVSTKRGASPIAAFTVDNIENITKNNKLVFFFLSAPWCKHCKLMEPIVKRNTGEEMGIKYVKIDISKELAIAEHFNASDTPTLVFFKNGKQVWRYSGEIAESDLVDVLWK